jgi:hypothetical protein
LRRGNCVSAPGRYRRRRALAHSGIVELRTTRPARLPVDLADQKCDRSDEPEKGGLLSDRLDEDKVEQLRRWGVGLSKDASDEVRATGKAILLLIEEIERLHVDLWNAKAMGSPEAHDGVGEEVRSDASLETSLRARLRRIATRGSSRQAS